MYLNSKYNLSLPLFFSYMLFFNVNLSKQYKFRIVSIVYVAFKMNSLHKTLCSNDNLEV